MSLEKSIADLTAQAGLLLDLPQAIQTQAFAKIDEITQAYNQRIATLRTTSYVNQATGLDTNPGTPDLPYKSIEKAVAATPLGGMGLIHLQAPYVQAQPVMISHKYIVVSSQTAVRQPLSFNRFNATYGATTYRELAGFRLEGNASINFSGLRLNIPPLDGIWPSYTPIYEHLVVVPNSFTLGQCFVGFGYVDLDIPTTPFGQLINGVPTTAWIGPITFVGQASSLTGKLLYGYTSTAGSTPPGWFTVNLSTI